MPCIAGPHTTLEDILKRVNTSGELRPEGITKWLSGQDDYELLLDLATHGADLMYKGTPPPGTFPNRVPADQEGEVTAQIAAEVNRGWLIPLPAHINLGTPNAPLQIRQETAKIRRITDYSHVVAGVKQGVNAHVDMDRLGEAPMSRSLDLARAVRRIRSMTHHDQACPRAARAKGAESDAVLLVRDVSKAFRRIGVRRKDIPSLHFRWNGQSYLDTRLPFGHAASAHYCCKLTAAVAKALTTRMEGEAIFLAYVDDFIIVSKPAFANKAEIMFQQCMMDIGLPISESKACESGSWCAAATWIGFSHDTTRMSHSLPTAKRDDLRGLLHVLQKLHTKGECQH